MRPGIVEPGTGGGNTASQGVLRLGVRVGNWLTPAQGKLLLEQSDIATLPARVAASFTTSHGTFGVMPLPQTLPALLIERNTVPSVIPATPLQDVNCGLDPLRYRNRPDVSRLALQGQST